MLRLTSWSARRHQADSGSYYNAGSGLDFTPIPVEKMLADGLIDEGWAVPDEASFKMSRILAKTTGALLGPTTGMQVFAALRSRVSHIFYLLYAPRPASSFRLHTGLCRTFARSRAPRAQIDSCHRLRRRSRIHSRHDGRAPSGRAGHRRRARGVPPRVQCVAAGSARDLSGRPRCGILSIMDVLWNP